VEVEVHRQFQVLPVSSVIQKTLHLLPSEF
jgi:hypothetical protein